MELFETSDCTPTARAPAVKLNFNDKLDLQFIGNRTWYARDSTTKECIPHTSNKPFELTTASHTHGTTTYSGVTHVIDLLDCQNGKALKITTTTVEDKRHKKTETSRQYTCPG